MRSLPSRDLTSHGCVQLQPDRCDDPARRSCTSFDPQRLTAHKRLVAHFVREPPVARAVAAGPGGIESLCPTLFDRSPIMPDARVAEGGTEPPDALVQCGAVLARARPCPDKERVWTAGVLRSGR
ncbi:hypothetical protein Franean1_2678 [Parafrankia sp. EAN1pec]|nr:hypothetical protein Franean1_2678 [Frankia sp. EAN1pec]